MNKFYNIFAQITIVVTISLAITYVMVSASQDRIEKRIIQLEKQLKEQQKATDSIYSQAVELSKSISRAHEDINKLAQQDVNTLDNLYLHVKYNH